MRILLTNDDGVWAEGILALAKAVTKAFDEVHIVAPDRERSAISHAITMGRPLRVKKVRLPDIDATAWAVDGTPADCVKLALDELLPAMPGVVVSGVNGGPNLGTDVLYSGTVAGATEAMLAGMPAIAASLATYGPWDFNPGAEFVASLAAHVARCGFRPGIVLNVNIPGDFVPGPGKVSITRLGVRKYDRVFEKRVDPRGRDYFWLAGNPVWSDEGPEYDSHAIMNGRISITPLRFDLTCGESMKCLKAWDLAE